MKLVGFKVAESAVTPQDGDIVVDDKDIVGYVCTTRIQRSAGLHSYGMALVNDGYAIKGEKIRMYQALGKRHHEYTATVIPPHFYDPDGRAPEDVREGCERRM